MGFTYISTVGTQSYIGWFLRAIPLLQNGVSLETSLKNQDWTFITFHCVHACI